MELFKVRDRQPVIGQYVEAAADGDPGSIPGALEVLCASLYESPFHDEGDERSRYTRRIAVGEVRGWGRRRIPETVARDFSTILILPQ